MELANVPKIRPTHLFRQHDVNGTLQVQHITEEKKIADIFTNPLDKAAFVTHRQKINGDVYEDTRLCASQPFWCSLLAASAVQSNVSTIYLVKAIMCITLTNFTDLFELGRIECYKYLKNSLVALYNKFRKSIF